MKNSIFARAGAWRSVAAFGAAAGIGLLGTAAAMQAPDPGRAPYLQAFPNFSAKLSPRLPGDVDMGLKARLEKRDRFADVQREFDLYSWQMFLALAWPTNDAGMPASSITRTDFGAPAWTRWVNSHQLFLHDGGRPSPQACGGGMLSARDHALPVSRGLPAFSAKALAGSDGRSKRMLGVMSAVGELHANNLDEITQAFSGPLVDQNGEFVFYEILVDRNEAKYICDNGLYNINGQVAFSAAGKTVNFPSGSEKVDGSGAFEIKLAWRVLKDKDPANKRFFTMPATIMDPRPKGPVERNVTVGLVGMHIAHKSVSSKQWIWSTFEHVDNLEVDPAVPGVKPSFYDPDCDLCAVNQEPAQDKNGNYARTPTQAKRMIPVPAAKRELNRQAAAALKALGSVWQYYQLIDTQWPTRPQEGPSSPNGPLPDAVTNKAGGRVTPPFLTNITMETYFQGGNQLACQQEENPTPPCPAAGPSPGAVWASDSFSKAPQHPNTLIFATESCTGCHSSANIYTAYDPVARKGKKSGQLSGDFSWLMAMKASYQGGPQPAAPAERKLSKSSVR